MALPKNTPGELHVVAETEGIAALCLEGDFDLANASKIIEEGERLLVTKHVILDLGEATFIDSAVVHALFTLASEARTNRRVAVLQLGTAAIVERVLEVSCIDRVLPRVRARAEAIETIRRLERSAV